MFRELDGCLRRAQTRFNLVGWRGGLPRICQPINRRRSPSWKSNEPSSCVKTAIGRFRTRSQTRVRVENIIIITPNGVPLTGIASPTRFPDRPTPLPRIPPAPVPRAATPGDPLWIGTRRVFQRIMFTTGSVIDLSDIPVFSEPGFFFFIIINNTYLWRRRLVVLRATPCSRRCQSVRFQSDAYIINSLGLLKFIETH